MAEQTKALRLGKSSKRLDTEAVRKGVREECPFREGFFVTVLPAASYNPRYRDAVERMAQSGDDETQQAAFADRYNDPQFIVDALVADMDGLFDEAGEPVPYTPEIGLAVLEDEGNADVKEWLVTSAHKYAQFYTKAVEADAGN